jgi:hypothetical protein
VRGRNGAMVGQTSRLLDNTTFSFKLWCPV